MPPVPNITDPHLRNSTRSLSTASFGQPSSAFARLFVGAVVPSLCRVDSSVRVSRGSWSVLRCGPVKPVRSPYRHRPGGGRLRWAEWSRDRGAYPSGRRRCACRPRAVGRDPVREGDSLPAPASPKMQSHVESEIHAAVRCFRSHREKRQVRPEGIPLGVSLANRR